MMDTALLASIYSRQSCQGAMRCHRQRELSGPAGRGPSVRARALASTPPMPADLQWPPESTPGRRHTAERPSLLPQSP